MGIIRDIFLIQALRGSEKRALAARDPEGNAVCGGCRTPVAENATTCPNCTADLYTKRGQGGRRLGTFFGLSFLLMALLPAGEGPGLGLLGSIVIAPIGLVLLYLAYQWYRNRPVREMNTRELLPF
ncbi:hypothetical protein [Halobellus sp. GM3]|uniref:hypothetical protein n=1 Tax=Halobellus sp. GM3 TaxID=3458410 RepID=UPI00403D7DE0